MKNKRLETGTKYDDNKLPLHLIPAEFLFACATVLRFGAQKYEEGNWAKGMKWSRCFSACMRHLWSWWSGAGGSTKNFILGELDEETKYSHLWHAACCILFLVCYEEWGAGEDDRLIRQKSKKEKVH